MERGIERAFLRPQFVLGDVADGLAMA